MRSDALDGYKPVNPHVFNVEPYGRLFRRYRWRCSCGAIEGGLITKTSAVFDGNTHVMGSNQ